MAVRVAPFSALPFDLLSEYLADQSELPRELLRWKYFSYPDVSLERGFACLEGDQIVGALGLIPFRVCIAGQLINAAWSCDWSSKSAVSGIILMQQLLRSYPLIYSLGGSKKTQMIMPRLAQYAGPEAGVELHKPLRLGGVIRAGTHIAGMKWPRSLPLIDNIRTFRRRLSSGISVEISSQAGVILKRLPELNEMWNPQPAYDIQYLDWLLYQCPTLSVRVAGLPNLTNPQILTLFWTTRFNPRFWRMAVLGDTKRSDELIHLIDSVLAYVYAEGGWLLSVLTSRFEENLLHTLKQVGFVKSIRRRPLFILNRLTGVPSSELRRLSYLDTDYAYRFIL